MTIAISLKVHNGIVLAADSAASVWGKDQTTGDDAIINIYPTARKIFNLFKGLPIGLITWGQGAIGHSSISTLTKDLRERFMGKDPQNVEMQIDPDNYEIEKVAELTRQFFYEEKYRKEFINFEKKPDLGFIVAGYSSGKVLAEEWEIKIDEKGACTKPTLIRELDVTGISWRGQPEAITRLIFGYGTGLPIVLKELGLPDEQAGKVLDLIRSRLEVDLATAPMPIQDAIDLAIFLAEVAIMFSRFTPGANIVGGPVDVAAITKYEKFKWIRRKHWYDIKLNPKEGSYGNNN